MIVMGDLLLHLAGERQLRYAIHRLAIGDRQEKRFLPPLAITKPFPCMPEGEGTCCTPIAIVTGLSVGLCDRFRSALHTGEFVSSGGN
jgi:hypothetical protein